MVSPYSLDGRTILITGASSGIGARTAIECSKMGANVIISGRNRERLLEVFSLLTGTSNKMILADLANDKELEMLVNECTEINGLVCNAGFTLTVPVMFLDKRKIKSIFEVNTFAPMIILQRLLKEKKLINNSSVVFTSSVAGVGYVTNGNSIYSASKGAISAFVRNAALELSGRDIRVNAVCPGMVDTKLLENNSMISSMQIKEDIKKYPLHRYGKPEDIAYAIIFFLSSASSWITGTNLIIDGGHSLL